ncbi:MAG: WD40 repeat domain-containing protein [Candidatus Latescibacterota bacterium]|nr:WD40 repeat domain-containing protein [Candidatus Latescibacterota bacterium]
MSDVDFSKFNEELIAEFWQVTLEDYVIDVAWSPNRTRLAAVTVEGSVFLIEDQGDSAISTLLGQHAGGANSLSFCPDGTEFATTGHDGLVKCWNAESGQLIAELDAGDSWVAKAVYNPLRNVLATAAGKHLKIWSDNREVSYASSDHSSTIADIGWNPDGSGLAVAAYNGITLHVPGKQNQPRKYTWKGSSLVLEWSPDSKYIATGEQDSTVHFWHVKSGEDAQMWGFPTKVMELSWDTSGRWLATGGGSSIALWDCSGKGPTGRQPREYEAHPNKLTQLAFQPDGAFLASADADGLLFLWDPLEQDEVIGGLELSSSVSCLRWCKEGKFVVGQEDGKVATFGIT